MEQEVHVETGFKCFLRIAPFGDKCCFRIFFIEESTNLLPQQLCVVMIRVRLYEAGSHVDAETVAAQIKPE